MSARAHIIPCPECGARHGDQCTYAKCPRKSFRTRGDRRPRQAIIGLPPASRPVMAAPFIGLAGASSCARFNSCALKFDGGVDGHAGRSGNGEADSGAILLPGRSKPARSSRYQARPVEAYDRGPRTGLTDRRSLNVACDLVFFTTGLISPNSTRGLLVNLLSPGDFPEGSRLFSSLVRRCNGSPCDLTETPEHVSVTPIVRFQTSNEGAFLCRNLSAKTAKAQ